MFVVRKGIAVVRVHSLELENFMLYKKFKRIFGDKDIIGLIGNNKEGKSTILEAMMYALHGTSRAEREVELIHRGADKMLVKLTLIDDGKKFVVQRGRDRKNHGLLEVKGVEKKGEAQATVDSLVGYDKDEFGLTCFFKQMDINQFMELGGTDKKKHLMQWLKNTHWIQLEKAVGEDLKELNKELISIKSKLEMLNEDDFDEVAAKKKVKRLEAELEVTATAKQKLDKRLATIRANRKVAADIEAELDDLNEQVEEKREAKVSLSMQQTKLKSYQHRAVEYAKETKGFDEGKLRDKKAKLSNAIEDLDDKISRAEDDMTGTCPILNEPCDRVECDSNQVKKWKVTRKKVYASRSFVVNHLGFLKDQQKHLEVVRQQESRVDRVKVQATELKSLEAKIASLEAKKPQCFTEKITALKEQAEGLQDEAADLSERIGRVKQKLITSGKMRQQLSVAEKKLTDCQSRASELRYLVFMFGKNGIPSQEIENAFDDIEDEINFVLERLGTRLQIEFKPDKELQSWEDYCVQCGWQYPKGTRTRECEDCGADRLKKRKDELQLRVLEDGEDEGFHMESGGGKTLVSLAVRLALTRLKQRQTNSKFNVLFLDEPDAALDDKNKRAFVKLITKTLVKEFGFEQIFWISHDKEIQESIPYVLHVQRVGKESRTRWVS